MKTSNGFGITGKWNLHKYDITTRKYQITHFYAYNPIYPIKYTLSAGFLHRSTITNN